MTTKKIDQFNIDRATRSELITEVSARMIEDGRHSIWQAVDWRSRSGELTFEQLREAARRLAKKAREAN
jgi:hypothetical protein